MHLYFCLVSLSMKSLPIIFIILSAILFQSCQTYVSGNGKKYRQFLPAKDRTQSNGLDTGRFTKQPFNLSDYTNKVAYKNNKRIIVPLKGGDISALVNTKGRYYLYFWNAGCGGTTDEIHKLDSISKHGGQVFIISMRSSYDVIDRILSTTAFSQYPYYTIEDKKYSNKLLMRKIRFIKEACESCYEQYKDELAFADYILIENGTFKVIMSSSETNMLK